MADRMTPASAEAEAREANSTSKGLDPEALRGRLEAAEQQRDEYLAWLKRARADFENYQKRVQRDLAEERRYAHADLARELLPALDNLQRALDAARQQAGNGSLTEGVAMVQSQLLDALARSGVKPIDAMGKPFDPHLHEAVMQQPRADVAPGTVVAVLEPGYRLHERVLRPARVVVASAG
jgi:molecular chaperone GrpE